MPKSHAAKGTVGKLAVETVADLTALDALKDDWDRLSESAKERNAFSTFAWFDAWMRRSVKTEGPGRIEPHVLVLRQGGQVEGIAPLVRRTTRRLGFKVRRLEFASSHADYNRLAVGKDMASLTDAIVTWLAQNAGQWDVIDLRDLPDDGDANACLESALLRYGLAFRMLSEEHPCPHMPIEGTLETTLARLSGHERRVLRRRTAMAAEAGISVRVVEHPEREAGLLDTMMTLERKKHERSEFPPILASAPEVFQTLLDELGPRGWLYVALLERGGEPIAFQLGFRCGEKLWDYNKAYDRAYARVAPGTLLVQALAEYCHEHGFREYDFLRGEEPYKLMWSTASHTRSRYIVWNRRPLARLRKLVYFDLKPAVYRLLRRRAV